MLFLLAGCAKTSNNTFDIEAIQSYKDIPGVTDIEIAAVEALRESRPGFIYGQMAGTESFPLPDGSYAGFTANFCDLLSQLFEMDFRLELYDWDSLKQGIDSKQIDFTGDLTPTQERLLVYHMTHPIAERSLRVFQHARSADILTEKDITGMIVGSLTDTTDTDHIRDFYPDLMFTVVDVESLEAAAYMLSMREIDLFVTEAVVDPFFDNYSYIKSRELFPLVYTSVAMTTANPDLKPIIDVVNKYLIAGGIDVLFDFYRAGNDEYTRTKLIRSLTEEEKEYLLNLETSGATVKIALEQDNYPVSFFNRTDQEFQGIAVDVLARISELTGITFETANNVSNTWSEILDMLRTGQVSMVSQLLHSEDRKGLFLWPDEPYASAHYALLSRAEYPNLATYQVVRTRVGTIAGSAYEDRYNEWFHGNDNLITYNNQDDLLDALESGEIDLLIGTNYLLLMQQNYREKPEFKINIRLSAPSDSYFGLNIMEGTLRSIVSKAQSFVDTDTISNDWTNRSYDYSKTIAQQRSTYFLVVASALAAVLVLTVVFLVRNRRTSIYLDKKVNEMTLDLRTSVAKAEEANKAKSAFLSTMSHEIRTPMNAILGITEIQLHNDKLDDNVRDALGKIYVSGDMLLGIINDILDLSKIEAGRLELIPAKYEIASFISDTAQLNMMRIGSKSIEFELFVDENMPAYLLGDELRVKQILNNILSNAFKYTMEGTVKLSVSEAPAKGNKEKTTLVISVSDTGQGMTKEQVEKLFDEYSRFNTEANRTTEGTGLGMSITRNLIHLMDGEISIESEPGKGTTFTVRLPQGIISDEILGKESADNLHLFRTSSRAQMKRVQITRDPMPYGSVLIVDDVETNIYVARGLMMPYKLMIDSNDSGFGAVEKIKNGYVFDIIFMDHMMPKMDGIEATRIIREMGYTGSIVALTANAVAGQAEIFLKNGFDDYISKPIDVRQLNTVLNKLIRDKQPPEVIEAARKQAAETEQSADDAQQQSVDPRFAEIFVRDALRSLSTLETIAAKNDYSDENDLRTYTIHVHGIKTALANIGRMELSAAALKLESAGRDGMLEIIASETGSFLVQLRALVQELTPDKQDESDGAAEGDPAFLREKFLAIKAACGEYDESTAESAISELREKSWPQPAKELIETIAEHLLHSDFDEIVIALADYE